jgi:hypothetical protein
MVAHPNSILATRENSSVFYASADVKGLHYDANAIFNEKGIHSAGKQ